MRQIIVALALVAAAVLMPVASADPVTVLTEKGQEKAGQAAEDPAAFVAHQTQNETLSADTAWSVAYGCYAAGEAEEATGANIPDVERCAGFEEIIGIAEEERPEEPVAIVEPADEDAAAIIAESVDDALAVVGEIVEEPTSVVEELTGSLGRFLDRLLGAGAAVLDGITLPFRLAGSGIATFAIATFDAAVAAGKTVADGIVWVADGIVATAAGIGTGIASAASATGSGATTGAEAVGAAMESSWDAVRDATMDAVDAIAALWSDDPEAASGTRADDAARPVGGLVDGTGLTLEDLTRDVHLEADLE